MKKTIGIILLLGLVACETPTDENSDKATKISTEKQNLESQNKEETIFGSELEFVKYSHQQLREGNLKTLKKITDGTILFSPYAYIDTASARIVPVNQLIEPSDEIHYWGDYDATGDAINMTTEAYLDKYVFSFNIEAENVVVQTLDGKPKAY